MRRKSNRRLSAFFFTLSMLSIAALILIALYLLFQTAAPEMLPTSPKDLPIVQSITGTFQSGQAAIQEGLYAIQTHPVVLWLTEKGKLLFFPVLCTLLGCFLLNRILRKLDLRLVLTRVRARLRRMDQARKIKPLPSSQVSFLRVMDLEENRETLYRLPYDKTITLLPRDEDGILYSARLTGDLIYLKEGGQPLSTLRPGQILHLEAQNTYLTFLKEGVHSYDQAW